MHAPTSLDVYDKSSVCGVRLLVVWLRGALPSGGRGLQGAAVTAARNVLLSMLSAEVGSVCMCMCVHVHVCVSVCMCACARECVLCVWVHVCVCACVCVSVCVSPFPSSSSPSTCQTRVVSMWCCVWPSFSSVRDSRKQTWRHCWTE